MRCQMTGIGEIAGSMNTPSRARNKRLNRRPLTSCAARFGLSGSTMPLTDVRLQLDDDPVPADVRSFLHEADRRIEEFQRHARVPGFVPSDFPRVYRVLRTLSSANLT